MAAAAPSTLALTSIPDGSNIVAADHRNNYAAVQVGVNGLIAMVTTLTAKGDLLVATTAGTVDRLGVGSNGQAIVADSTQALGMKWGSVAGTTYRKTTSKTVNTTTTATDLLNGEITIAGGAIGGTGLLRLTAWGDWLDNIGANTAAPPRFQLLLGGTTLFDTSTSGTAVASSTRYGWRLVVEIMNAGSAAAQVSNFQLMLVENVSGATDNAFTTGEGVYHNEAAGLLVTKAQAANPSTTVNTATSAALVLNVINGSANAAYETKLLGAVAEII